MKKLCIIVLIFSMLVLSACGSDFITIDDKGYHKIIPSTEETEDRDFIQNTVDTSVNPDASPSDVSVNSDSTLECENQEMNLDFSFGTRRGMYSGSLDADGLPDGYGIFSAISSDGISWTYEGNWKNGHWNGQGTTEWETGQKYTGAFKNDYQDGFGVLLYESGEKYNGEFNCGEVCGNGTLYYPDGTHFSGSFIDISNATGSYFDGATLLNASLVGGEIIIEKAPDFFSDEERQSKYEDLYKTYRYSELISYIEEYLSSGDIATDDSAYSILEMIEPLTKYEDQWLVTQDEFDGAYYLSFVGANSISETNSVSVTLEGTGLDIKVGFVKNGWLFFDGIDLSIDGERVYGCGISPTEVTRNVLSRNKIEEYCFCDFYDDVLEQLSDASTVIIRFSNDDSGEHYDHTLSQAEIDALYCGLQLRKNNRDLSNLLYRYVND